MKFKICHLYADLMNTYGDDGNVITLVNRLKQRGIDVEVDQVSIGNKIDTKIYNLFFFGGGQDQQQINVSKDLAKVNGEKLKEAVKKGSAVLSICGGYQLLGHYYLPIDGKKLPGVGLLNVQTVGSKQRMIGNIVVNLNDQLFENIKNVYSSLDGYEIKQTLVGFENHSGQTFLSGIKPLGNVISGFGNNGDDKGEGAFEQKVFGCYLHGSLLPKNPHFADYLIYLGLKKDYNDVKLEPLDDTLEWQAHHTAIKRAKENK